MSPTFRKNLPLITGIAIPLIAMVFFALAAIIPQMYVNPPTYDVLFMNSYIPYPGLKIYVNKGIIRANYTNEPAANQRNNTSFPINIKLYLFTVKTQKTKEITVNISQITPTTTNIDIPINIPELVNTELDPATTSPDGYQFHSDYSRNTGNFIGAFFLNGWDNSISISKNGYILPIKPASNTYRFYSVKLLGWLIPKGENQHGQ